MNRRSFVQTVGLGAIGAAAARIPSLSAQQAGQYEGRRAEAVGADVVRIGSNENPYGPAPSALAAIATVAPGANRYPGVLQQNLTDVLTAKHGIAEDHLLLSCGSGDLLKAIVMATTSKDKFMVAGTPSYESPIRTAKTIGSTVKEFPLTSDLRLDLAAMTAAAPGAGLVYICNPNNPTSTTVGASAVQMLIEKVVATSPSTFILVDEAYFEYADSPGFGTALPLVARYPQVIVARTMSKIHAMAGMRVGYAVAQPATLKLLQPYHSNSGLNSMSLAAATASLKDDANTTRNADLNREVRKFTVDAFTNAGYTVAKSDANFIFVNIKRDARAFQDACRQKSVMVGRVFPPMTDWARISIGTMAEMKKAVPVFMEVLGSPETKTAFADFSHLDALPSELT